MHIHLLRTHFPHWGQYSGIYQFEKYINSEKHTTDISLVSDNDQDFPIQNPAIRNFLRTYVQKGGMHWYKLSDLNAELVAFRRAWHKEIDIVHYLDGEHSAQFLPTIGRKMCGGRIKLIATYHQPPELLDSLIDKKVIPHLDLITVVSPDQAAYFQKLTEPHKVCCILHGIDTHYFKPGDEREEKGKFKCITVGKWLRDYKAFRCVAQALAIHQDIEFNVVSGGISEIEGLSNVKIHTGLDDSALLNLYQQSDILFLPLEQSTANNALLEGIACGLPVVSTDLTSVRSYVPGPEAILIKNNDPNQFVQAILHLFDDQPKRQEMALSARRRALELDWKNIALSYENIYSKLS